MNLARIVSVHCKRHRLGVLLSAPVDVVFGEGKSREGVQPDIVSVRAERRSIITVPEMQGPPDLVVEIPSPGTAERDRKDEKALRSRYGVRECWIVDPDTSTGEVGLWEGGKYGVARIFAKGEVVTTGLLPGLEVRLDEVFDLTL